MEIPKPNAARAADVEAIMGAISLPRYLQSLGAEIINEARGSLGEHQDNPHVEGVMATAERQMAEVLEDSTPHAVNGARSMLLTNDIDDDEMAAMAKIARASPDLFQHILSIGVSVERPSMQLLKDGLAAKVLEDMMVEMALDKNGPLSKRSSPPGIARKRRRY